MENDAPASACYCMTLRALPTGDLIPCHHCYARTWDAKWRQFEESLSDDARGSDQR